METCNLSDLEISFRWDSDLGTYSCRYSAVAGSMQLQRWGILALQDF